MPSVGELLLIAAVPEAWQWTGLGATFAGTLLSLWAALSAVRARRAAEAARAAAVQLGRTAQIADLASDMQELETLIARSDLEGIAARSNHLRSRIARFEAESYAELSPEERGKLVAAQIQLANIVSQIRGSKAKEQTKLGRIQLAVGEASAALNSVAGHRRAQLEP